MNHLRWIQTPIRVKLQRMRWEAALAPYSKVNSHKPLNKFRSHLKGLLLRTASCFWNKSSNRHTRINSHWNHQNKHGARVDLMREMESEYDCCEGEKVRFASAAALFGDMRTTRSCLAHVFERERWNYGAICRWVVTLWVIARCFRPLGSLPLHVIN